MKDYKTLIADIRTEACELADKLKRLEVFMMSEDFLELSPEQKGLLEQQYDLMAKYKVVLVKRAYRINYEHANQTTKEKLKRFVEERAEPENKCVNCKWYGEGHDGYACLNVPAERKNMPCFQERD